MAKILKHLKYCDIRVGDLLIEPRVSPRDGQFAETHIVFKIREITEDTGHQYITLSVFSTTQGKTRGVMTMRSGRMSYLFEKLIIRNE